MSEYYEIRDIEKVPASFSFPGAYVILINATKVPPHLCLVVDGKVFSLTVKGPKIEMPLGVQLGFIAKNAVPALFVKLKADLMVEGMQIYKKAVSSTLLYERVEAGIATCLSPLKAFCESVFSLSLNHINFVYDLIAGLEAAKLIEAKYGMNLPVTAEGEFKMKKYGMQDIYESIYAAEYA